MDEREILRAWKRFTQKGTGPSSVRGIVAASWRRSQQHDVPTDRSGAGLAPEPELVQRQVENSELIGAARPALEQARIFLADAKSMVILTDPSGVIVETEGDPRAIDGGRQIHLERGGQWAEGDIGTNAIGTAIATSRPVEIHGFEHFCSEVQPWACAATPIWHPTVGELVGVLDISGSAHTFNPQSLGFASAVARQIENTLAQSIREEHEELLRYALGRRFYWVTEHIVVIDRFGIVVHANDSALHVLGRSNRGLIQKGRVLSLKNTPFAAWPVTVSRLVPDVTVDLAFHHDQAIGAILVLPRMGGKSLPMVNAAEMQALLDREREISARQRTIELAKANQALQTCLDSLASVPELDELVGQMMTAMTRQLGAVSSVLRLRDFERNCLTTELVFQDGRVFTAVQASDPPRLQSIPLDESQLRLLAQPAAVLHFVDDKSTVPDEPWAYLLELGIKTLLIVPLNIAKQLIGGLSFRFTEQREFRPEEIEIARALESQTALAIQVTRLAKAARQAAILQERTRLAGEIHDGLAQNFTGICMQLGVATQELALKQGDPVSRIQRALELAKFGVAEARRCAHNLRLSTVEESGLTIELQRLVERSSVTGRLQCSFESNEVPEDVLPPRVKHQLLRISQEAVHNAVRHANPSVIAVTLHWSAPNLILEITDDGSGIAAAQLAQSEGFGLANMRNRATEVGGSFELRTAAGRGTSIIVRVPAAVSAFEK